MVRMIKQLNQTNISGTISAIASKSMAHRLMICSALAKGETELVCSTTSKDMEATANCLSAMKNGLPMPCGESGSTLRFLLPVVSALGLDREFHMEGRLPQRPLAPLDEQLKAHGVTLSRPQEDVLALSGQLTPGDFCLPGNVSSQYISGLLLALPLLDRPSTLTVTGKTESASYIEMTLSAMKTFGVLAEKKGDTYYIVPQRYQSPGSVTVEGDWSNAAFWLCAGALGAPVTVTGLDPQSLQGDRAICGLLSRFGAAVEQKGDAVTVSPGPLTACDIDASAIPDLVPALAVVAAAARGTTRIFNAGRLRLKESDRLETVAGMLAALGGKVEQTKDGLLVTGTALSGGTVDSCNDHRIAMAAAVASTLCSVTVTGAEAVNKSYPHFWEDMEKMQNAKLGETDSHATFGGSE